MKTKLVFTRIFAALLALLFCFSIAGCGDKETSNATKSSKSDQTGKSLSQEDNPQTTQNAIPAVEVEMCWSCGQAPVVGSSTYCSNCKCMVCNQRRKFGNYMYCNQHNCNESGCAAMATSNSQYCVSHKCAMPNCSNKIWAGSQYCAAHK